MAETYHYLWIKRKNDLSGDCYYYSLGITKEQAKKLMLGDDNIVDYDLSNDEGESPWSIPM